MSITDVNNNPLEIGKYYIVDDVIDEEVINNIKYVGISAEGNLLFQSRTNHGGDVSYMFSPDVVEIRPVDNEDPASDFEVEDFVGGVIKKSRKSRKSKKIKKSRKSRKSKKIKKSRKYKRKY